MKYIVQNDLEYLGDSVRKEFDNEKDAIRYSEELIQSIKDMLIEDSWLGDELTNIDSMGDERRVINKALQKVNDAREDCAEDIAFFAVSIKEQEK